MKRIQFFSPISHFLLLVLLVTGCTGTASAKVPVVIPESETSGEKTLSPYFVVVSEHPETDRLPLKSTRADVNIVGVIADVTIKQSYVNSGRNTLEAIYTFPLSTKAAVYAMKMTIGKRVIEAKISEKDKARKDYAQAKSDGKRASLLEQNRPNVFTMKVANIAMHDTIVVELHYTELLVPERGVYSFVYPTVVGPRYSNKPKEGADADNKFVNSPYTEENELPTYKFGINFKISSAIPIQDVTCTTHKMNVTHPDLNTAVLKLDQSESEGGNRDVILNYSLQGNKIESGVMLYEHGDENFFLMMIQPPKKVLAEEIPPREYIFIMDVSGSMQGFPIDISKKLLRNLIVNLKPTDKFNVVLFAGYTGVLNDVSVPATPENVDRAIKLIDGERGGGGTELLRALKRAYQIPRSCTEASRSFVLVTDGFVDVEKESFELVRNNNANSNFFCFGIGTSVNRYLLEGMAFMGKGEPIIVENPSVADKQAERFRNYINSPVLSQIKVDYGAVEAYDIEPGSVPDMLAERPIIIFGKYRGNHAGIVKVQGYTGQQPYEKSFDLSTVKPDKSFAAIRYLWARERIKLLDYYSSNYVAYGQSTIDNFIKNEITQLGLKYGLMTQYTSFLAIDHDFRVDKDRKSVTVHQPLPLPKGVSNSAVGQTSRVKRVTTVYSTNSNSGNELKSQEEINNSKGTVSIATVIGGDDVNGKDIADLKEVVTQVAEEKIYDVVEQMPSFPGGESALAGFVGKNLQYPAIAQENGIQGTVIVRFKVNVDGSISDVQILRSLDPACDKEAIRIIRALPRFIPAKQNGANVAVWYTFPVKFKLE